MMRSFFRGSHKNYQEPQERQISWGGWNCSWALSFYKHLILMQWPLFNEILPNGVFPLEWSKGAIYKSGDKDSTSNYRGITLLSVMLKVLFYFYKTQRMKDWAEIEGKLHDYQFEFRTLYSIIQLMLYIYFTNFIREK